MKISGLTKVEIDKNSLSAGYGNIGSLSGG
jgi:hypothetical protein